MPCYMRATALSPALFLTLLGGAAVAEPAKPSPLCSTFTKSASVDTAICQVLDNGDGSKTVKLGLTVNEGPVDVGGYRVTTTHYNNHYMAPTVEVRPGDTLKVWLQNDSTALAPCMMNMPGMACDPKTNYAPTNLHTHGMVVSPDNDKPAAAPFSDNVLVSVGHGALARYKINIPSHIPASVLGLDGKLSFAQPNGLYWYHPHFHMLAQRQVTGGMSGMLAVGSIADELTASTPADAARLATKVGTDYLGLRDLQVVSAVLPEAANRTPAELRSGEDYDFGLCGEPSKTTVGKGYCLNKADGKQSIWLFTINGQRYPAYTVAAGRKHVWRIANLSASATYTLRLKDQSGAPQPYSIVTLDGISQSALASAIDKTAPAALAPTTKTLVLMPAGRADILIANDGAEAAPDREWELVTEGADTGSGKDEKGEGTGDQWPALALAKVVLPGHAGLSPVAFAPAPLKLETMSAFAGAPATPVPLSTVAGCVATDADRSKGLFRQVSFVTTPVGDAEEFQLGSEILAVSETGGEPAAIAGTHIEPQTMGKFMTSHGKMDWTRKHVCVSETTGAGQIWKLVNTTDELHNFHVHQTTFRIATADELKAFFHRDTAPISSPDGVSKPVVDAFFEQGRNSWHDTVPVPANNGYVYVVINFTAPQQIGRYMFHCHILEHEDKGMMAAIEVLP